jgi:hypothetical protein
LILRYDELILESFANNKEAVEFYKNSGWSRSRNLERREVPNARTGVPELWPQSTWFDTYPGRGAIFLDEVYLSCGEDDLIRKDLIRKDPRQQT